MSREEFMARLEQLLNDISLEERQEAMDYYAGYFEDAGVENEDNIIRELESPEKVAQTIKAGLNSDGSEGVFTERGYQQQGSYTQAPVKVDLSKSQEGTSSSDQNGYAGGNGAAGQSGYAGGSGAAGQSGYAGGNGAAGQNGYEQQSNKGAKIALIVVIALVTSPIWGGLVGGIVGVVFGLFGGLVGVVVGLGATTIALFCVGGALLGAGISELIAGALALGLALIGAAFLVWALAMLTLILFTLLCGKFIPWLIRSIVALIRMPFDRNKKEGFA